MFYCRKIVLFLHQMNYCYKVCTLLQSILLLHSFFCESVPCIKQILSKNFADYHIRMAGNLDKKTHQYTQSRHLKNTPLFYLFIWSVGRVSIYCIPFPDTFINYLVSGGSISFSWYVRPFQLSSLNRKNKLK